MFYNSIRMKYLAVMILNEKKIAAATVNQTPLCWEDNVDTIVKAIEEGKKSQVDLLCFPELALTSYGCEDLFLSDWLYEKAELFLSRVISYTKGISISIGVPVLHQGIRYNAVVFVENQLIKGIVAKQNLAIDGVHYEYRWFTPWEPAKVVDFVLCEQKTQLGDLLIEWHGYKIGFEICEDAWKVERPGHRLCEKGVDLIINPSASPFEMKKSAVRHELVRKSSEMFNCAYVYANLLGNESGRLIFDGELILASKGDIIASNKLLSFLPFQILSVENGVQGAAQSPEIEFRDAVALGLFDYLRKSHSKAFVLSLSGGADSSICAVLVHEMLKKAVKLMGIEGLKERLDLDRTITTLEELKRAILITAYQGTINSSKNTLQAAKELSTEVQATFYHWLIDDEVAGYTHKIETVTGRQLTWEHDDIALQNIQARTRSPIIWMLTNISSALLLTTSNRSEGDVGYATMDGDTSGSLAPIAGVDKQFVRSWLVWAENTLGYKSLRYVNNLQPSAELRPLENVQTDEEDLMPYDILLAIEKLAIGQYYSPLMVYEALQKELSIAPELLKKYIKRYFSLWSRNQWKRERIAPSFHLDSINVDPRSWCRFPILSGGFRQELKEL